MNDTDHPGCDVCADQRPFSGRIAIAKFDVTVMAGPPLPSSTRLVTYLVCGAHLSQALDFSLPVQHAANVVINKIY